MKEEINLGQHRIILVGTGHVFQESVDLARTTILEVSPDYVALELDPERLMALQSEKRERLRIRDIFRVGIRLALFGSVLSYFQDKVGEETGVFPGTEMLEAMKAAKEVGAEVVLIDRSVMITLNRLMKEMSLVDMLKIIFYMLTPSKMGVEDVDKETVDELTEELHDLSPGAHKVLIEERDTIMAQKIFSLSGTTVVVMGAGHVKGVKEKLIERYKKDRSEEDR